MLRKLASFFFQEEEIILEEDLKAESEENYKIPEIKPMKARRAVEKPVESESKVFEAEKQSPVEARSTEEEPVIETVSPEIAQNKSKKITADSQASLQRPVDKRSVNIPVEKEEYQPQEIISPIFGGSQKEGPKKVPSKVSKEVLEDKRSKTTVISPMFGLMEEDSNDIFDKNLMNYDLRDMLSANEDAEEVQVSLYDFLEELEDEK